MSWFSGLFRKQPPSKPPTWRELMPWKPHHPLDTDDLPFFEGCAEMGFPHTGMPMSFNCRCSVKQPTVLEPVQLEFNFNLKEFE